MQENLYDDAFIACNKFIKKSSYEFGTGIVSSYNEEIEKAEAGINSSLKSNEGWLKIQIPNKDFFLDIEKSVREQSKIFKQNLFTHEALKTLFIDDFTDFYENVEKEVKTYPQEKQLSHYTQRNDEFFEQKTETILSLKSVIDLVEFITNQTRNHDLDIASSFLAKFGASGVLFNDDFGKRILIFNPQRDVEVHGFRSLPVN